MKRYVRLKNGKIIDTFQQKGVLEGFNEKEYYYVGLSPLFCVEDIVAQSVDVIGLIEVGDLVCDLDFGNTPFEVANSESSAYEKSVDVIRIFNDKKTYYPVSYEDICKIYTKQGDNYVLVWDNERGVI